ncbi:uncharacterized protein BJ171DRAFT_491614 [Polychytrium aggregatum]|uniref:uncharacterized protein n=1 Tax=Polychytrium aggregatum TaxID=110093 RepID=UPI0022FDD8C3|nr:uncharacterized protein BJ171DRAFT_491614 [Polychytrium aggregatum]KAI9207824.1 hypothetical protein BJ171DRAFT_491614 [Polychytrium aggregatum]
MGFTDLDKDSGLKALNTYLEERSYIEGYEASQADVAVYEAVKKAPDANKYPHAARWYHHIWSKSLAALPGKKQAASAYGPGGAVARPASPVKAVPAKAAPAKAAPAPAKEEEEDEDDIDLFGSDDDDEEAERLKAERVAAYEAKKAGGKPKPVAKSMVILDVKPWDDETDMKELTNNVLAVEQDGLVWGTHKLVAVGFGIKKLQITCVIEDDKVSTDELIDKICADEDHVQSVDIAAFNKL